MWTPSQIAHRSRPQRPTVQPRARIVPVMGQEGMRVGNAPLRVAVVDDDDDLRAMVALCLRLDHGCELLSCASAEQALRELPAFQPDVIVLDYMMPGMNGLQALAALSGRMDLDRTRVVITSAATVPEQQLLAGGACALLPKPFDALHLGDYLVSLCAQ